MFSRNRSQDNLFKTQFGPCLPSTHITTHFHGLAPEAPHAGPRLPFLSSSARASGSPRADGPGTHLAVDAHVDFWGYLL